MNEIININFQVLLTFIVNKEAHAVGIINDDDYKKLIQDAYNVMLKTNENLAGVLK